MAIGLKSYLSAIGQIPIASPEEVDRLVPLIRRGNQLAKWRLVRGNLRLVVKIAKDFKNYGLPLGDMISAGNIGLARAAEKFEGDRGANFSSYAAYWIKQKIRLAIANQSRTVRIPVHAVTKIRKIRRAREGLRESLGREATVQELSDATDLVILTIRNFDINKLLVDGISMDKHIGLDETDTSTGHEIIRSEQQTPLEYTSEQEAIEIAEGMVDCLDSREKMVITEHFGLNGQGQKPLALIATEIGLSREMVRKIKNKALARMYNALTQDLRR